MNFVANPNGIVVDGGGFINTSRGILTTGTPNFGPSGNLAGFNVTGGHITVQGAGLNATNVDQVDLIARAIQVNAAIYANNLNVIAGANQVDHGTPIAVSGAAPSLAIDVSQLGGMYANRIYLASNEYGVGVSNRGVLAAQAGDLTLTSNGMLVLAGQPSTKQQTQPLSWVCCLYRRSNRCDDKPPLFNLNAHTAVRFEPGPCPPFAHEPTARHRRRFVFLAKCLVFALTHCGLAGY